MLYQAALQLRKRRRTGQPETRGIFTDNACGKKAHHFFGSIARHETGFDLFPKIAAVVRINRLQALIQGSCNTAWLPETREGIHKIFRLKNRRDFL